MYGCGSGILGSEIEHLEMWERVHWGWVDDVCGPEGGVGRVVQVIVGQRVRGGLVGRLGTRGVVMLDGLAVRHGSSREVCSRSRRVRGHGRG